MVGQNQGRFTLGCLGTQKVQFQVTYRVSSTKGITRGTINFLIVLLLLENCSVPGADLNYTRLVSAKHSPIKD